MRLWTDQTFSGGILDFEMGAGRKWWERWPSKIDSNWGKHCCCCWFGQKWPSIPIKNDSRIFEIPESVVLRIQREDLWKKRLCAHFYYPHSLTHEQREDRVTSCQDIIPKSDADKNLFLTKLLRERRPGGLPLTPKQSDRILSGLVRHPLGRRNWHSKGSTSKPC